MTGLLRERLGFNGLVLTDALNMRAVADAYGPAAAAVRALSRRGWTCRCTWGRSPNIKRF